GDGGQRSESRCSPLTPASTASGRLRGNERDGHLDGLSKGLKGSVRRVPLAALDATDFALLNTRRLRQLLLRPALLLAQLNHRKRQTKVLAVGRESRRFASSSTLPLNLPHELDEVVLSLGHGSSLALNN